MHSVAVVGSSCLVYSASLAPAVSSVFATLLNGSRAFPTYCTGAAGPNDGAVTGVPGSVDLDQERELQTKSPVPQVKQNLIKHFWINTSRWNSVPKKIDIQHSGSPRQYWVPRPPDVHLHKWNHRPPQGSCHKACSLHLGKVFKFMK